MQLSLEGPPEPSINWHATLPNLQTLACHFHDVHTESMTPFYDLTPAQGLVRARLWLKAFPHFKLQCRAASSLTVFVSVRALCFSRRFDREDLLFDPEWYDDYDSDDKEGYEEGYEDEDDGEEERGRGTGSMSFPSLCRYCADLE